MTLDDIALELEYVDSLLELLQPIRSGTSLMIGIYDREKGLEWAEKNIDTKFSEAYQTVDKSFRILKTKVEEVNQKYEDHTFSFKCLRFYISQIDTSLEQIGLFFEKPNSDSDKFRENFKPYGIYPGIILHSVDAISSLSDVYDNFVDVGKIKDTLAEQGKYHS